MNKKEIVRGYIREHKYFSLTQIVNDTGLSKKIIKDYLFQLKQEKIVFDAGRQIYSSIKKIFQIVKESRVENILRLLKKSFPFTDFLIWNTRQLQPLYLHTQQHHITFIDAEKESIQPLSDRVSREYRGTLIEKRSNIYFNSVDISKNPVVIRKLISRSIKDGHIPPVEKILVDMFVDLDKYKYISPQDYWYLWESLCSSYRINFGYVYNYSKRRKCLKSIFNKLTGLSSKQGIDLRHLLKESGKKL